MRSGSPSLAALLFFVVGCGANVVFGEDGSGNGGVSGTGGSGNESGTGGSGNGSGTGGSTPEPTACEELCASGCFGGGDCVGSCLDRYFPGCEDRAEAFVSCSIKQFEPGTCNYTPHLCDAETLDYYLCAQPFMCATDGCDVFGGGGACNCSGTCQIPDSIDLDQSCTLGPSDVECDCFAGGGYVGSCTQSSLTCELEVGCCFTVFLGL